MADQDLLSHMFDLMVSGNLSAEEMARMDALIFNGLNTTYADDETFEAEFAASQAKPVNLDQLAA